MSNQNKRLERGGETRNRLGHRRRATSGGRWCTSTTDHPESGYCECAMKDRHRGLHRDLEGTTWSDEYSIN